MRTKLALASFAALALLFVTSLWVGWAWFVTTKFPDSGKATESAIQAAALRGQFGDMFGGINAFFTALLLAGAGYTIWIQQRQIQSIREQQVAFERDSNRSATLLAMTALVNARGTLLSTRYAMMNDLGKALKENTIDQAWRPMLEVMAFGNVEKMGKDFKGLDDLATELEMQIENIKNDSQPAAA